MMNDDLIKKSDAIEAVDKAEIWSEAHFVPDWDRARQYIDNLPSADRLQGEWIWKEREFNRNYKVKGFDKMGEEHEVIVREIGTEKVNYCSACGKRGDSRMMNFCPNCGAKMKRR